MHGHDSGTAVDVCNCIIAVDSSAFPVEVMLAESTNGHVSLIRLAATAIPVHSRSLLRWDRRFGHSRDAASQGEVIAKQEVISSLFELADHFLVRGEDGVVRDLLISLHKNLRNERFVTRSRDNKVDMSWPVGWSFGGAQ